MSLLQAGFGSSGDDYEITDSLRLRDSASASLTRTPSTAPTNAKKFTLSVWVKLGIVNNYGYIYNVEPSNYTRLYTYTDGKIYFDLRISNTNYTITPTRVFRDPSAWYHIVWAVDTTQATASDRVSIYINGVKETSFSSANYPAQNGDTLTFSTNQNNIGQYNTNAHHFDGYLTEFNGIDGQALTADDFGEYDANGTWKAKEYTGTYGTNGFYLPMKPTTQAELQNTVLFTGTGDTALEINNVGYEPDFIWFKSRSNAQNHYLVDSVRGGDSFLYSNATTAENTSKTWVSDFTPNGFIATNQLLSTNYDYVGWTWDAGDNQPSTGHSSIHYSGNGAELKVGGFGFNPDLVWIKRRNAANNNQLFDSVRGSQVLVTNETGAESDYSAYFKFTESGDGFDLPAASVNMNASGGTYVAWGWDAGDGDPALNEVGTSDSTVKASDTTGFSIVSYTGTGANATVGHGLSTAPSVIIVKERTSTSGWFVYTSMTGAGQYLNLHSSNAASSSTTTWNNTAPTSSVFSVGTSGGTNQSSQDYIAYCFSEVSGVSKFGTYPGNGSSNGPTVTGLGFRPGFVLVKATSTGQGWTIWDSTRSPFNTITESLSPNANSAESNFYTVDFNDDGFQLKSSFSVTNQSGQTYMYIAFKGSYSDHVSPLNDTGTIDSRVKANPDKGFSVVSYTGDGSASGTVGHGLSAAPDFIITKTRSIVNAWNCYHASTGAGNRLFLSGTNAATASSTVWNNTSPTSTVFSVGDANTNGSGTTMIAYCFSEVAGYSKIDSYTGTGVAGLSVTTGFRPAFVMTKRTDSTSNWNISDSRRSPTGTANTTALRANTTDTENTVGTAYVKFTDTGFEITGTSTETNASGGTYIYMAFADTADAVFNFDASGNKNNWLPNNINSNAESETTYDLMKDTPSLVDENAANFATLNPLNDPRTYVTYSDANLTVTNTTSNAHSPFISTIGMAPNSGKYYWESIGVGNSNTRNATGIGTAESMPLTTLPVGFISGQAGFYIGSGTAVYFYDESGTSSFNVAWAAGNVFMHCYDANTGKFWIGQNGVWYNSSGGTTGDPATGANPTATFTNSNTYFPLGTVYNNSGSYLYYNFGQRPFAYTPPTGYSEWGSSTVSVSGGSVNSAVAAQPIDFQPDLVWIKGRSYSDSHGLVDSVRGANKILFSNNTSQQGSYSNTLTSFDSNGFTLGADATQILNKNTETYVAWCWKAGGAAVSNTDGSITSTVSANQDAGFSVVKFDGASGANTVGHGLSQAPDLFIMKSVNVGGSWGVYVKDLGANKYLTLNDSAAVATSTGVWNNTHPTSTLLHWQGGLIAAGGTGQYNNIAYCFHSVDGYQRIGTYTGAATPNRIYTTDDGTSSGTGGFKPRFLLIKADRTNNSWVILDAERDGNTENGNALFANLSIAEWGASNTTIDIDFVDDGFILQNNYESVNYTTATTEYIYLAIA